MAKAIRVGQLRKWNRPTWPDGSYTYFLVIGERVIQEGEKEERSFTVRYPDGTTQEYWEGDLMPGFNEIYDYANYSAEVTSGDED